jgi:hypothetical protein
MFLWLVVGLFVVSIVTWVLGYKLTWHYHYKEAEYYDCWSEEANNLRRYYSNKEDRWELIRIIGKVACCFVGVILFISLLVLTVNHACSTYNEIKLTTEYESLCYKASMIETRDEFGLLNKEYIDEIHEWNMKVKEGKYWQNHFWFGVFNPDIYDSVDVIDLRSVEMGH